MSMWCEPSKHHSNHLMPWLRRNKKFSFLFPIQILLESTNAIEFSQLLVSLLLSIHRCHHMLTTVVIAPRWVSYWLELYLGLLKIIHHFMLRFWLRLHNIHPICCLWLIVLNIHIIPLNIKTIHCSVVPFQK